MRFVPTPVGDLPGIHDVVAKWAEGVIDRPAPQSELKVGDSVCICYLLEIEHEDLGLIADAEVAYWQAEGRVLVKLAVTPIFGEGESLEQAVVNAIKASQADEA